MYIQRILILLALIAGAVWLSFYPGSGTSDVDGVPDAVDEELSADRHAFTSEATGSPPVRRSSVPVFSEDWNLLKDAIVVELESLRSTALQRAVAAEVDSEFADFFAVLELDAADQQIIRNALVDTYTEIRLVASAMEQGVIDQADVARLRNPDFVLNALSEFLDSGQLTELEDVLERRARRNFNISYSLHEQTGLQALSASNRELLLETLFRESYALTSPDGLALAAGVADTLDRRLEAIAVTRSSLFGRFTGNESAVVEEFLDQQERAIAAAAILFDQ